MRLLARALGVCVALAACRAHAQTDQLWIFKGDRREENVGTSVALAPDVSGDGVPDVVVGAPFHGSQGLPNNKGAAYLLSGADGSTLRTYAGEVVYDGFGAAVAGLSDADGDGKGDVAVAAPYLNSTAGKVYVFSGGSGAAETPLYSIEVADRILDGRALSGGPDADGDQIGDVLVASFSRVGLYSGADGAFVREWPSTDSTENFGASAVFGGMVSDGMGGKTAAVVVGAPDFQRPPGAFTKGRGRVYVYDAASGAELKVLDGPDAGSSFGYAVAISEDMSGDGYDDLVVGAPSWGTEQEPLRGKAYVYSGADFSLLYEFKGLQDYDAAGSSVSGAADADGDGAYEIAVGAPGASEIPAGAGGNKDVSFLGLPKVYFISLFLVLSIVLLRYDFTGNSFDTGFGVAALIVAGLLGGKAPAEPATLAFVGAPYEGHAAINHREGTLYAYRLDFRSCPFLRTGTGLRDSLDAVVRGGMESVGTAGDASACLRGIAGLP